MITRMSIMKKVHIRVFAHTGRALIYLVMTVGYV